MQKGKVPKVTCVLVNCSPVEVVLWEELFVLTKRETEICHDTRVYAKKQREEDEEKYERVGESYIKITMLTTYLGCLAVLSQALQLEVAVQSRYGDTA